MKIEHIAVYTNNILEMKQFYETYFNGLSGPLYVNEKSGFMSYFLSFDGGSRLELMARDGIDEPIEKNRVGIHHFAISVGDLETVTSLTNQITMDGYDLLSAPRWTGDGYFESVVLDPDGNHIEITV